MFLGERAHWGHTQEIIKYSRETPPACTTINVGRRNASELAEEIVTRLSNGDNAIELRIDPKHNPTDRSLSQARALEREARLRHNTQLIFGLSPENPRIIIITKEKVATP